MPNSSETAGPILIKFWVGLGIDQLLFFIPLIVKGGVD